MIKKQIENEVARSGPFVSPSCSEVPPTLFIHMDIKKAKLEETFNATDLIYLAGERDWFLRSLDL